MHLGISTFIISILVKASTDLVIKSLDGDRLDYRGIALKVETRYIKVVGVRRHTVYRRHASLRNDIPFESIRSAAPFLIRSDKTRNVSPTWLV